MTRGCKIQKVSENSNETVGICTYLIRDLIGYAMLVALIRLTCAVFHHQPHTAYNRGGEAFTFTYCTHYAFIELEICPGHT
jgi:hypothetical protein